jgi:hypothetical protein
MRAFAYADSDVPIRDDIPAAHRRFWEKLARPGAWWTGAERVRIAQETRNAVDCALCVRRKRALSPYAVEGLHESATGLPARAVDAVHRVITDAGRITRSWIEDNERNGLAKTAYVELVGIAVAVFSIDEFHRAMAVALEPLPVPGPGAISRYVPEHLSEDIGFVPTVSAAGAVGPEADLWRGARVANVLRALTLVPDALRDWRSLAAAQYLSLEEMANYDQSADRALNRMQMELVAARVSAINECFY